MSEWTIAELVPHDPPALLLDEVIDADEEGLRARLMVRADGLYDEGGYVPAVLGIEYMAQAVAAFSGLQAKRCGAPVAVGFLLGTRRFTSSASRLKCGETLTVSVHRELQNADGMGSFSCEVSGDDVSQSARLSVFEPQDDNWRPDADTSAV